MIQPATGSSTLRRVRGFTVLLAFALAAAGCSSLRTDFVRHPSTAMPAKFDTPSSRYVHAEVARHSDLSGFRLLTRSNNALMSRIALIDHAAHTIDLQYYIFANDDTGRLVAQRLLAAADRGVRVRMLLDDITLDDDGRVFDALDAHPEIEVRRFNPFHTTNPSLPSKIAQFILDGERLNRRMHNKSFTVDGRVTLVGGRNIGDEYFGASREIAFVDLDVLAIGPIVADVAADFERYWNSASATPVASVLAQASDDALAAFAARATQVADSTPAAEYLRTVANLPLVHDMLAVRLPWIWAPTRMLSDDPAKGLAREKLRDLVSRRLAETLGAIERELYLVSPYFVPTARGAAFFAAHARRGIRVMVLTNSLEATDVIAVHAGYAKRRRALLRAGVHLFELRRTAPGRKHLLRGRGLQRGSSGASLHSKTFSLDCTRMFVGSFNFDQRSARLNTEIGLLIDSPELARESADAFATTIPLNAYEARLRGGKLEWLERNHDGQVVHTVEPGTTFWQRALVRVLARLPIDWLL
jgi:putative cardiolipin synthase